jgi:carboxymethylenebutenolidase
MEGQMIDLKTTKAYIAEPEGSGSHPAIIIFQEWWGLNDNIKGIADRFTKEGFLSLAVDLYKGQVAKDKEEAQQLVDNLCLEEGLKMSLEALEYLKSRQDVGKIAVTGFCMGGKYALLLAGASEDITACVPFYGHVPQPADEKLKGIKAAVLGHYAEKDDGISPDEVQLLKDTLTKCGVEHEIIVYEGAHHGFMNDTKPNFNPEAAKLAWSRTIEFLNKHIF